MNIYALIFVQTLPFISKLPAVHGVTYEPSVWVKEYQVNYVPVDEFGQTFEEIVEYSNILADKTLLIKAIIESEHKVFLITLPEKWGKSTNLMMLKTFFGIAVYSDGTIKYRETSWSYQYFKKGFIPINFRDEPTNLLSPPLISKYENLIEDYLGRYPVVYLNFTFIDQWTEKNFAGYLRVFKQVIGRTFEQHGYLMGELREKLNHTEANYWCAANDVQNLIDRLDRYTWEEEHDIDKILGSVQFLSHLLHKRFGKPAIVLIDNYDVPLNEMYIRYDFPSDQMKRIKNFYFQFLERSLKNNADCFKAMVVGELNVAGSTENSSLPTTYAKEHTVLDNQLFPFYGLMKPEVEELRVHAKIPSRHSSKANKRYSGYRVGNATVSIYNMWSVARFLNKRKIRNYWKRTQGSYEFFFQTLRFEEIRTIFKSLLLGTPTTVRCQHLRFDHENLAPLKQAPNGADGSTIDRSMIDLILQYFLAYGYLTLTDAPTSPTIGLKLPNAEIEREIAKELHRHYSGRFGFNVTQMASNESLKLIQFLRDDVNVTLGLHTLFTQLFRHSGSSKAPVNNTGFIGTADEDAAYCLLYVLALQTKIKKNVDIIFESTNKTALARDVVLCSESKALLIRLTYRTGDTSSLGKQYQKFFKTHKTIKRVKFVQIIVASNTTVHVESGTLNVT